MKRDSLGLCTFAILIRAPVWGAMRALEGVYLYRPILICAPVWGAMYKPASEHFTDYILIRAPVWGAMEYDLFL